MKVANSICCLNNFTRATSQHLIRLLVLAYVLAIALFYTKTWWPGHNKTREPGRIVLTRVEDYFYLISRVALIYVRATLPVYRITPAPAFLRDIGILPPDLELNKGSPQAKVRTYMLNPRCPRVKELIIQPKFLLKTRVLLEILYHLLL